MSTVQTAETSRQAGADAISTMAVSIGNEVGIEIMNCVWDLGRDYSLEHAHRLDIVTDKKSVRVYFPDIELTAAGTETRKKRTEARLRGAIAQLQSLPPAPTYSFK